jgi:hypothetical protein
MADYHSLLMRAVANLPNASAAATRRAIYDRARHALLTQLRTLRPPLPESDIAREENALDAAIAQIESGLGSREATAASASPTQAARTSGLPQAGNGAAIPLPPKPAAAGAPTQPAVSQRSLAPAAPENEPAPGAPAATAAPQRSPSQAAAQGPPRPSPSASVQSAPPQRPLAAGPARSQPTPDAAAQSPMPPAPIPAAGRPPTIGPAPARPPVAAAIKPPQPATAPKAGPAAPMVAVKDAKDEGSGATALDLTKAVRSTKADDALASAAPPVVVTRPDEPVQAAGAPEVPSEIDRPGSAARHDLEGQRPIAPGVEASRPKTWLWIAAAVVLGIVIAVAGAAIVMRQKPQDLAIKPPAEAQAPAQPQSQAKIAERVGPQTPATPASPSGPATEPRQDQTGAQGAGAPASPARAAQNPPAAPAQAPAPASGRAAMLVASADNPQKPVVSLGSTVWSLIPAVPGQPATIAVKADADIPDLKMHATMTLRKNTDPTLQATHTIDLKFSFADGAPITGFKDVGLPQMRKEDSTAAEALTSVKVKISDVYFLIALAKGDTDTARNLDLMQTRSWFDFPLLLDDNRIAKVVFQKSPEGEAMLEKAFDAWK